MITNRVKTSGLGTPKPDAFCFWQQKLTDNVCACWLNNHAYVEFTVLMVFAVPTTATAPGAFALTVVLYYFYDYRRHNTRDNQPNNNRSKIIIQK